MDRVGVQPERLPVAVVVVREGFLHILQRSSIVDLGVAIRCIAAPQTKT